MNGFVADWVTVHEVELKVQGYTMLQACWKPSFDPLRLSLWPNLEGVLPAPAVWYLQPVASCSRTAAGHSSHHAWASGHQVGMFAITTKLYGWVGGRSSSRWSEGTALWKNHGGREAAGLTSEAWLRIVIMLVHLCCQSWQWNMISHSLSSF